MHEQHFGQLHTRHSLLDHQAPRNPNYMRTQSLPDGLQVEKEPTQQNSGNYAWFAYSLQRENFEKF